MSRLSLRREQTQKYSWLQNGRALSTLEKLEKLSLAIEGGNRQLDRQETVERYDTNIRIRPNHYIVRLSRMNMPRKTPQTGNIKPVRNRSAWMSEEKSHQDLLLGQPCLVHIIHMDSSFLKTTDGESRGIVHFVLDQKVEEATESTLSLMAD
jgi:hypothetical protein